MSLPQSELPPHDGACFYLPRDTFSCLMVPPSSVRLLFCSVALTLPPPPTYTPAPTHTYTRTEQTPECGHLVSLFTTASALLGELSPGGMQTSNV